jgi:hypothetical protein
VAVTAVRRSTLAWSAYAAWLALSYLALLSVDRRYLWHVPLLALAALLLWKPGLLRPRAGRKASVVHYLLASVAYAAFIGQPLALLGHGDLVPNLLLNSFLWIGSFAGVFVAWRLLLQRYRFTTSTIVACAGLLGWIEPGLVLVRLALAGAWQVLVVAPVLHAAYAALVAPAVAAYRERFGAAARPPTPAAMALAVLLPAAGFYLGMLWIAFVKLLLTRLAGA